MVENARALGLDATRVAIYGQSAGGGLTVATALRARDREGPKVRYVMAIYPMLDPRHVTPSSHAITDIGVWDRAANVAAWAAYLNGRQPDAYASPLSSKDLTGYPPTYIDVGTEDLFRDEDLAFASQLLAAGVPVELHVDPGAFHGSEALHPGAAISQRQLRRRLAALRAALHPSPVIGPHQVAARLAKALGNPNALAELLQPEATWTVPTSLGSPVQVGREAIVAFRRGLYHDVLDGSTLAFEIEQALVDDDNVALRGRLTGVARNGQRYDNDHALSITLRDGQIHRVLEMFDPARAHAQISHSPGANEESITERVSPTHVRVVTSIEIDAPHDVVWVSSPTSSPCQNGLPGCGASRVTSARVARSTFSSAPSGATKRSITSWTSSSPAFSSVGPTDRLACSSTGTPTGSSRSSMAGRASSRATNRRESSSASSPGRALVKWPARTRCSTGS
jgi:ketosteroid isomerase-like protein/dienelactone hydrolase